MVFIHSADWDKFLLSTYCVLLSLGFRWAHSENRISKEAPVLYHILWSEVQCVCTDRIVHEGRGRRMNQKGKFMMHLDQHAKDSVVIIKSLKVFELKND